MSHPPRPQPKIPKLSPGLIGAGVLVIALGFGLPVLTSGSAPTPSKEAAPPSKEPASKQETAAATPAPIQSPSAVNLGASLLRLAVGLGIVCGLCVLIARWAGQKQPTAPGSMEVLASLAVARSVVHLVRAGDRRLLIGTDLGGVKAILELPGPGPELPSATPTAAVAPPAESALPPDVAPAPPPSATPLPQEAILKLLAALRAQRDAAPPG